MKFDYRTILILLLILVLQIVLRVPFLQEPLERDEGAYAYIAQRMLAGELPYRDYFDHKPPAVYFIYAGIFKLFGDSQASIRLFTLFFSLIITLSVFGVGYLIWGGAGGLISAFLFALFSGGPLVHGTSANTETFLALPLVLALLCFLISRRKDDGVWIFWCGLLSGLAVMIKQVAIINFLVFLLFYLFFIPDKIQNKKSKLGFGILTLGFLIVPVAFSVYFWLKGIFPDFMEGFLFYNLSYAKYNPWHWTGFVSVALWENLVLWILSLIAVVLVLFKDRRYVPLLLLCWGLGSFAGVLLGKTFYGHYFLQVIPALVFLSTYTLLEFFKRKRSRLALLGFGLVLCALVGVGLRHWVGFLTSSPERISINKYATLDFVTAPKAAEFIRSNSSPQDIIFVWGSEPEVYFYSKRRSASKYIYYYPLLYPEKRADLARERVLEDVKKNQPRYIVMSRPHVRFERLFNVVESDYLKIKTFGIWQIWERK